MKPYLPGTSTRGFTGIKYYAITGAQAKVVYDRGPAMQAAADQAQHFLESRMTQLQRLGNIIERPALLVSPYDAELFGHWWYEGLEFLDFFVRKTVYDQKVVRLTTPQEYLAANPTHQIVNPSPSTWGEDGHLKVWLNDANQWILPHLDVAQTRMTELVLRHATPDALTLRGLKQAGRELLLAQSSDWPFIMRTGTSPEYAARRVQDHLLRFLTLHEQLTTTRVQEPQLAELEAKDNLFPDINPGYWAPKG